MKISRILVPVDFSIYADMALEQGLQLAERGNAELIICHINPVPAGGDAMFFINDEVLSGIEQETERSFQKLIIRFPQLDKIGHKFVQKTGLSVDEIRNVAEKEKADLIIMGTKGRDKSIEAYFGSNTSDIMRRSKIPVLAIPENAYIKPIRNILLATDFEVYNYSKSMKVLASMAKVFNAEIHIIKIVKNEVPTDISVDPAMVMNWADIMKGIEHHYHFVSDDNVQNGIIRYAYENEVEMLAVLGKTYNLIDRIFHKSLSKKLVYHSKLPLLVLVE